MSSGQNLPSTVWYADDKYFYYTRYVTSNDNVRTFILAITYFAIPVVSLLGVAGNIMTMCVVRQNGFKKSYNIFILALAMEDSIFLIGVNNIPRMIYKSGRLGFDYPRTESTILHAFFLIQYGMEMNGKFMSMILPTFVSIERFIAVYFPLHLKRLVTCRRARTAVVILFISWIPFTVYFSVLIRFGYSFDPVTNTSVGYILRSDLMLDHPDVYKVIAGLYFMISGPVSVVFVVIVCGAIGVKMYIIKRQRLLLTSVDSVKHHRSCGKGDGNGRQVHTSRNTKHLRRQACRHVIDWKDNGLNRGALVNCYASTEHWNECKTIEYNLDSDNNNECQRQKQKSSTSQTTLMLLSMCAFYSVIVTCSSVPAIIFSRNNWESDTGAVVELCSQLALCINSSFNFLIYVGLNRNFRNTLKQMLK